MQRPMIIGHHLIWTLYVHWLPNDPRGSGSSELRTEELKPLGEIHFGRKPAEEQPNRVQLREFQRRAASVLNHSRVWLHDGLREANGTSIATTVKQRGYTVWACAILSNHVHAVVRKHRDDALAMWHTVADGTREPIRLAAGVGVRDAVE